VTTGTHIVVGALGYAILASLRGWGMEVGEIVFAVLGSIAPDADMPTSVTGRVLGPVSRWLYRRVGHRTLTHSIWGIGVGVVLWVAFGSIGRALLVGWVSHLLVDSLNVQGVRFLWPSRVIFRFFRNPRYTLEVGRRGEYIFLVFVALALSLYWPVGRVGFKRMMHRAMKDVASAVMDYQDTGEKRETFLRVEEGTEVATGLPVVGRFRVVAALTPNELLVEADEERLWVVGEGQEVHVYPRRCFLEVGRPQRVEVGEFDLAGRTFRELREHLEGRRAYAIGAVEFARAFVHLPRGDRYETVVAAGNQIHLKHARWRDLEGFADEPIVRGRVRVKWVSVVGEESENARVDAGGTEEERRWGRAGRVRVVELNVRIGELRVREGDWVERGQLIAVREEKVRELEGLEAEARWRRERLREQLRALDVEEQQLRAGALDVSEEGSVEGARWRWEQAEAEYKRKVQLHREGIVSDQEVERARAMAEARRARYEELRGVREKRLRALDARRREIELAARAAEEEERRRRERLVRERDVRSPYSGEIIAIEPMGEGKVRVVVRERGGTNFTDSDLTDSTGLTNSYALRVENPRVIDGDTVEVRIGGKVERVRLIGVDAPEIGQGEWGERARAALERMVKGKVVRVEFDVQERDRYGRVLGYVWVDGEMANEQLLREGMAFLYTVPPNVRYVERFRRAQEEARRARRGIWGARVEHPAEWRRRRE